VSQVRAQSGGGPERAAVAAEERLRSLELFGMRFGLDRMHRLMTALGSPERRFDSLQVLGTNGKSSTTRMTAAILAGHGLRTAAYLSPHLVSYRERVLVDGGEMGAEDFVEVIERAWRAAERVNRTLAEGDRVTQFELLTAAAFLHMAEQEVEVAVIEAGLGGRYDATSVIEPVVTVLTNVGLEHTRWLGPTVSHIAAEKLAALPRAGTLVVGEDLAVEALVLARSVAAEKDAPIVQAGVLPEAVRLRARGGFQRRNLALAGTAARAYLDMRGIEWSESALQRTAASMEVRGRLQRLAEDPLTLIDGAHNPHAVASLVQSLPELLQGRCLALVLGVLEDKDAAAMLEQLLALTGRAWFTAPPGRRALPPAALQSLARQQGFERSECEPVPERALEQASAWAREHGCAVLVTGSVYLVGEILAGRERDAELERAAG
jgi:dihydrofolate synthase / folylpolyglutamate synthase